MLDQTKIEKDRELVVAAISALKARGSEVNANAVAAETKIPSSRLYRNTELIKLINEGEGNSTNVTNAVDDDGQKKINELEARILELEETIWNLEKSTEAQEKKEQDAYRTGYQAGVEEATRRLSGTTSGPTATTGHAGEEAQTPVETQLVEGGEIAAMSTESAVKATETETEDEIERRRSDTGPLPTINLEPITMQLQQPPAEAPVFEIPASPIRPKALPFELDFSSPDMSDFGSSSTTDDTGSGAEPAETAVAEATHQAETEALPVLGEKLSPSTSTTGDYEPLKGNYNFKPPEGSAYDEPSDHIYASEFQFSDGSLTSAPEVDYDYSSLSRSEELHTPTSNFSQENNSLLQSSLQQETHAYTPSDRAPRDPDSIYNVARSGPATRADFNPLVELSWKDLETVYNFSVASLRDYARPATVESPGKAKAEAPPSQQGRRLPSEEPNFGFGMDPKRTGDKLQAFTDPRNLFDSDAVVDLDALDIFDDLDDYVDIDKIDIIPDVKMPAGVSNIQPEIGAGGDELRELIKGRIKQAAELPHEALAPKMTAPPTEKDAKDKDADGAAAGGMAGALKGGGARNKFVGSAKGAQEVPVAAPTPMMIKNIPPDIRKACMILGIKPEDMTDRVVNEAWKRQIASPGVHPDHGGDTETAVFLNTAKDTLVRWLDAQAPKLGKKFGGQSTKDIPKPRQGPVPGAPKDEDE